MATPYQGLSDTGFNSPIYTPNYAFLANNMAKKESQYKEGVQELANGYNSITSQPVTNGENKQKQQEYIQQIQEGLKKVSTTDLSLPQNVAQAENLYAPFWKDKDLLKDIGKTKYIQSQQQEYDNARKSTDDKVRATADPYQEKYINMSIQDLQEAHRGDESIDRIPNRAFTPFKNTRTTLDAAAKDANLEVDWADPRGPVLYEHKNGEKAIRPFSEFARNVLGTDFDEQFRVMGEVDKRNKVNMYRQSGMSRQEAEHTVGSDLYDEHIISLNNSIKITGDQGAVNMQHIKMIEAKINKQGGATNDDVNELTQLYSIRDGFTNTANDLTRRLQSASEDQYKQAFINNSENYIAQHIKENLINTWATGRAMATESVKETANQAWKNAQDVQIASGNLNARWGELHETSRHNNVEEQLKGIKNLIDAWSSGYDMNTPGGQKPLLDPNNIVGYSADQLAKFSPADIAIGVQRENKRQLLQSVWSPSGLSGTLTLGNAMNDDEVSTLNTYIADIENGEQPRVTPEISSVIGKFSSVLKGAGIDFKYSNDFHEYGVNMRKAIQQYASTLGNNNKLHLGADKVNEIATQNMRADMLSQVYQNNLNKTSENIHVLISTDKTGKWAPVTTVRDDRVDLVHPEDIARTLPQSVELEEIGTNNTITVSGKDMGTAYYNNMLSPYLQGNETKGGIAAVQSGMKYNGKLYYINKIDGKNFKPEDIPTEHTLSHPNLGHWGDVRQPTSYEQQQAHNQSVNAFQQYFNSTVNRYGEPEQFKSKLDELTQKAIPAMYDKTGIMGKRVVVPYKDPRSTFITKGIVEPGNSIKVYNEDGTEVTDDDKLKALRSIGESEPGTLKKLMGEPMIDFTGRYGSPTVELRVNSGNEADEVKNADVRKLGNSKYYMVIDPNTANPYLKQILSQAPEGTSLFPELKQGTTYSSPTYGGASFQVVPDQKRPNPTGYTLVVSGKEVDPKTGIYVEAPTYKRHIGADEGSTDYIVNGGIAGVRDQLNRNAANANTHVKAQVLKPLNQIQQEYKSVNK